ncbi:uncharacterized protein TNCV_4693331 [Trichonephila clavipes]|uniref:Endonuclease/exonuclease/phosphatase domain-containing protein n=1 Tax=Trichonephila clavipes TaxID=2585209 RepID=A0A8X7BHL8_TRICX|nr:uncharacterized protein TNCV_4693331 [Trichonephila clavipes]
MCGSDHISRYSNEFVEWITDSNLVLLNTTVPTYRSSAGAASLIDLTVCSSSMSGYCNSYVLDCSFESDHVAVVAEWYRYRIVACLVASSSPVPLKTRRVGQRCTLNLSRAETFSHWCGVVVRRGGASSGVVHVT